MPTVLLMEDQEDLRDYFAYELMRGGWLCLIAADSTEALRLYRDHPVDALVVDLTLKGSPMSGAALVRECLALRPCVVVITSGTVDDGSVACALWIQKPFVVRAAVGRIRGLLPN